MMSDPRALLLELYSAAIDAAQPGPAVTAALEGAALRQRVHLIAIGKAAPAMAAAGAASIGAAGRALAGGVIVSTAEALPSESIAGLSVLTGDHPVPGKRSVRAATAIADAVRRVEPDDSVLVLLSGGASSLAAAPVPGINLDELVALNEALLASGLDISAMNRVRKRFLQWGAGRLAQALAPAEVRCLIASDVVDDDIAVIGSGPCAPDDSTAEDVAAILTSGAIRERVPPAIFPLLADVSAGRIAETPGRGDPAFAGVHSEVIVRNRIALAGAAERAAALGLAAEVMAAPLSGEAAAAGTAIGRGLDGREPGRCRIRGGETTVPLGTSTGTGGRCQELALAAAREMAGRTGVTLLAAGTDGRDGPTEAAGALVDGDTWARIGDAGRDAAVDLGRHDAFPALADAGALIPQRATGTNVADIVITLG